APERAAEHRRRTERVLRELTDVLAVERHDATKLRLGQRFRAIQGHLTVGHLDREVTGLDFEVAPECELRSTTAQLEIEILHAVLRRGAALAARDIRDDAVVDRDRRGEHGARAGAAGAATAARRALSRLRLLASPAERRNVHAAVGRLDDGDDGLGQRDAAELDATGEQRGQLETYLARVQAQERLGPELWVVRDLETVQRDGGQRQDGDRHRAELDG